MSSSVATGTESWQSDRRPEVGTEDAGKTFKEDVRDVRLVADAWTSEVTGLRHGTQVGFVMAYHSGGDVDRCGWRLLGDHRSRRAERET